MTQNNQTTEFDLIIIGGGPAGYTAAIRAAQLGMKVACVEQNKTLGGTCLNVGCIPSKALLNFSEKYYEAKTNFAEIGIKAQVTLDLNTMLAKKDQVVANLCKGIEGLFAKNKVTRFIGVGTITKSDTVEVTQDNQVTILKARNILIATGSSVISLPNIDIDEQRIVSSTGALNLQNVPKSMIVIGGGYIGLELGSVWQRLGSKVTVVEYSDSIVPAMDKEIAAQLSKILQKQGVQIKTGSKVLAVDTKNATIKVNIEKQDKQQETLSADVVLSAIGRKANTNNLGLQNIGIQTDDKGRIIVDGQYKTNVSNIYAVGDVIAGPMLAHKAEEEAVAAVEIMAGQFGHVNYRCIPSVIYTHPEVASIGSSEEELKSRNIDYKIGKFPFLANSRARTNNDIEGMVKILADSKTDEVLGAHIIGADAGTMIAEIAAFMEFRASAEDIARTCHAHPTLSEAIKEAALAVSKRSINI